MAKKKNKISIVMATLLVFYAIFFDVTEALLVFFGVGIVINSVIAFIKWTILIIWLIFIRINPFKARRLILAGATFLIGLMPGINAIPEFTIGIVFLIIMENKWTDKVVSFGTGIPESGSSTGMKSNITRSRRGNTNPTRRDGVTREKREKPQRERMPLNDRGIKSPQ